MSVSITGGGGGPPTIADFNGDGKTDQLWRNSDTGRYVIKLMDGLTKTAEAGIGGSLIWSIEDLGDFNNDT